jgi:hypothetical protein
MTDDRILDDLDADIRDHLHRETADVSVASREHVFAVRRPLAERMTTDNACYRR